MTKEYIRIVEDYCIIVLFNLKNYNKETLLFYAAWKKELKETSVSWMKHLNKRVMNEIPVDY